MGTMLCGCRPALSQRGFAKGGAVGSFGAPVNAVRRSIHFTSSLGVVRAVLDPEMGT
jgi:hypothetical protein